MRWQKAARLAIAAFVIVFAGIVLYTMRQRTVVSPPPRVSDTPRAAEPDAAIFNPDGVEYEETRSGRLEFRLVAKSHVAYADGRQKLGDVELTLPDRGGKTVVVRADEALLTKPPAGEIGTVTLNDNVRFTTDDGLDVRTSAAVYEEASGVLTVPGPVEFSRGRMKGTGVGATYDKNRDVLQLLDQARIRVGPDPVGQGAADATAGSAGLARAEHYVKLTRDARILSDDRTIAADEVTAWLQADGNSLERVELRGNSRITEPAPGGRTMSARDIDLTYAADGRTMERTRLLENAAVELPGPAGGPGRRIAASTIDMAMGPDGSTLTGLAARGQVQLDLPEHGESPAKRIRAASLDASGPPDAGLDRATFEGEVEYRETRAARGDAAAVDRTARAQRLRMVTAAGLGDVEQADFRGRFTFVDAAGVKAGAPRALYHVNRDRLELSPFGKEPGPTPFVDDGQVFVEAENIQLSPSTRTLAGDTDVRSTVQPARRDAAKSGSGDGAAVEHEARMPAMLDEDRPVHVASARLQYDGEAEATYSGGARLWQDGSGSKIDAETIRLDERTGNLTARTNVRTSMLMEDTDPKTKQTRLTSTAASADELVYEDAKRLAVYTGTADRRAQMQGVHGDVMADRIALYLGEDGRRLERADARGRVTVKEPGRVAHGDRLVYTASDDTYVMTGKLVEAIEREGPATCRKTIGTTLTFQRAIGSISADAAGTVHVTSVTGPCPPESRESRD